jgi:hypothetical protein
MTAVSAATMLDLDSSSGNRRVRTNAKSTVGGGKAAAPNTLSEALEGEYNDPLLALELLREASARRADELARELAKELESESATAKSSSPGNIQPKGSNNSSPLASLIDTVRSESVPGSESIYHALSKIAAGGSQASAEIRQLEQAKQDVDDHAASVQMALELRGCAAGASESLQGGDYMGAARLVRPWLDFESEMKSNEEDDDEGEERKTERDIRTLARAYLGESAIVQLRDAHRRLQSGVVELYRKAVGGGDLATLGQLTPVLAEIRMEDEAVEMYLRYLRSTLHRTLQEAVSSEAPSKPPSRSGHHHQQQPSPGILLTAKMAKVYNLGVQSLRHHLPLVSHCLWRSSGDVKLMALVHSLVEQSVLPLLEENQRHRHWATVTPAAEAIATALADRAVNSRSDDGRSAASTSMSMAAGMMYGSARSAASSYDGVVDPDADDCGFSARIGTLADVNLCMDETALLLQHSETYLRFVGHGCSEIERARQLRGLSPSLEIDAGALALRQHQTALHQALAELGGEYATVEHCLLLASMQRSFLMMLNSTTPTDSKATNDPRNHQYRPLVLILAAEAPNASSGAGLGASAMLSSSRSAAAAGGVQPGRGAPVPPAALQTASMDACWYAARKCAQRAFATGHTGTASTMVNLCVDALQNVLLEVATQRAEDATSELETLVVGSAGSLLLAGVMQIRSQHHSTSAAVAAVGSTPSKDEVLRKQREASQGIARACAAFNDLEVAASHSVQLEAILTETIAGGFPPNEHETEQLLLCVRSLSVVTDGFRSASDAAVASFEGMLKPRIRSMLGESSADGSSTSSASTAFIGSSVMKMGERVLSRMNYNLNDEKYNLLQLSEGYMTRLASALDELLDPLRQSLAPRLWDKLLLDVAGTVSKRLESSLRRCEFTSLGALALDADVRDFVSYVKERLHSPDYASNVAVARACPPLSRLVQIAQLLNVDDLDDALDLASSSKRKGNWDLTPEDSKAFLCARVEFENTKVNELLRLPSKD